MKKRLRILGLILIALLPMVIKRFLYQWCFGYHICHGVSIGVAFLDCEQLQIESNARIGHGVVFSRCGQVYIGKNAFIGALNMFRGGERIHLGDYSQVLRLNVINSIPEHDAINKTDSSFHLDYGAVITSEHRIDFTDRVSIGRCSILGGRNSSIWTHNRRASKPVEIGDYCYVGSEIRMAPGSKVPNCCVVGLGSILTRPLYENYSLIAGVPAKLQRPLTPDDYELIFEKTRADLPDEDYPIFPLPIVTP